MGELSLSVSMAALAPQGGEKPRCVRTVWRLNQKFRVERERIKIVNLVSVMLEKLKIKAVAVLAQ